MEHFNSKKIIFVITALALILSACSLGNYMQKQEQNLPSTLEDKVNNPIDSAIRGMRMKNRLETQVKDFNKKYDESLKELEGTSTQK
jgi:hypothetical protein